MHPTIIVTSGTPADIPPRPSIQGMLEAAHDNIRRLCAEEERRVALAKQRLHAATESAGQRAAAHVPAMLDFLRRRKSWTWTTQVRDEIQRLTGITLDCGTIARALRINGAKGRMNERSGQWQWRSISET